MLEMIGLQEDLVERTGARILEHRDGSDLSSTAAVFPSRRFGFFLRHELASRVPGHFFPPALYPIESFFESLFTLNVPGGRILDDLEAAHAVYESAAAVFPEGMYGSRRLGDFAAFLPWAQKVLAALEEILTAGGRVEAIDPAQFKEFAGLGDYHRAYREFILRIPDLLDDLRRRLDGRRQATRGMACRRVAELAAEGGLNIPPARHWIFSGFNAMNACEQTLYRWFRDRHGARLILRGDPRELDDPFSPFHLQAETLRGLGMSASGAAGPSGGRGDLAEKVSILPCDGVESEMVHAFTILEQACRGRDEAGLRRIAVLLPSSPSLIPFVQGAVSRFDQEARALPFNITLGYPLERTPMMQLVDSLLTILENSRDGSIPAGDYLPLVRHPYVKISGGGGDLEPLKRGIHLLENIIHGGNLTRFSIAGLEARLEAELRKPEHSLSPGLAAEISAQVSGLHRRFVPQGIAGMPALLDFLQRALESVGSDRNRGAHLFLNEYAGAALEALDELRDFASRHAAAFRGADAAGLAAMARSHFRGRTIRFEGSPLQGVQVMGPLEFRGLAFDEVVVLDALEGVLPGTAKYDPILPADIRAVFGVRDHGDWERIYALNFFAMLGAARRVHVLYPRRSEDGQERERSRFVERIAYALEKEKRREPAAASLSLPFRILPRRLRSVEKGPAVCRRLREIALSPSSLEAYVACPLQFYFARVLGLRERVQVAVETEGGEIGTIAHAALEKFYAAYPVAGAMAGAGAEALDSELERRVHEAFRELNFDPESGLERIRSWTLVEQLRLFVRQDLRRLRDAGIQVEKREKTMAANLAVPGLDQPVAVQGRLDRLEREDGLLRVIDYKTGAPFDPRVRLHEELELKDLCRRPEGEYLGALAAFRRKYPGMQLLVYLVLLSGETDKAWAELDAAFVFLRERGERMVQGIFRTSGRGARPFTPEERQAAMRAFVGDLKEVVRDLHARERFLANPADETVCRRCPYRLPCGNL